MLQTIFNPKPCYRLARFEICGTDLGICEYFQRDCEFQVQHSTLLHVFIFTLLELYFKEFSYTFLPVCLKYMLAHNVQGNIFISHVMNFLETLTSLVKVFREIHISFTTITNTGSAKEISYIIYIDPTCTCTTCTQQKYYKILVIFSVAMLTHIFKFFKNFTKKTTNFKVRQSFSFLKLFSVASAFFVYNAMIMQWLSPSYPTISYDAMQMCIICELHKLNAKQNFRKYNKDKKIVLLNLV